MTHERVNIPSWLLVFPKWQRTKAGSNEKGEQCQGQVYRVGPEQEEQQMAVWRPFGGLETSV